MAKASGRETLRTGGKILTDIGERSPTDTTTAEDIVSKHVTDSAQNLISKLRGRGRKRAHGEALAGGAKKNKKKKKNGPTKFKRAPRKIIERYIFSNFTSVTLQQPIISAGDAAKMASVSSEFNIFSNRPIQTSVLVTTEVAYKPIAPADQNDLEFLIIADNDTYIDLDIRLNVRGKLISSSGKEPRRRDK